MSNKIAVGIISKPEHARSLISRLIREGQFRPVLLPTNTTTFPPSIRYFIVRPSSVEATTRQAMNKLCKSNSDIRAIYTDGVGAAVSALRSHAVRDLAPRKEKKKTAQRREPLKVTLADMMPKNPEPQDTPVNEETKTLLCKDAVYFFIEKGGFASSRLFHLSPDDLYNLYAEAGCSDLPMLRRIVDERFNKNSMAAELSAAKRNGKYDEIKVYYGHETLGARPVYMLLGKPLTVEAEDALVKYAGLHLTREGVDWRPPTKKVETTPPPAPRKENKPYTPEDDLNTALLMVREEMNKRKLTFFEGAGMTVTLKNTHLKGYECSTFQEEDPVSSSLSGVTCPNCRESQLFTMMEFMIKNNITA